MFVRLFTSRISIIPQDAATRARIGSLRYVATCGRSYVPTISFNTANALIILWHDDVGRDERLWHNKRH